MKSSLIALTWVVGCSSSHEMPRSEVPDAAEAQPSANSPRAEAPEIGSPTAVSGAVPHRSCGDLVVRDGRAGDACEPTFGPCAGIIPRQPDGSQECRCRAEYGCRDGVVVELGRGCSGPPDFAGLVVLCSRDADCASGRCRHVTDLPDVPYCEGAPCACTDGASCPESFDCRPEDPSANEWGCVRQHCERDEDCSCGYCDAGLCHHDPGICE